MKVSIAVYIWHPYISTTFDDYNVFDHLLFRLLNHSRRWHSSTCYIDHLVQRPVHVSIRWYSTSRYRSGSWCCVNNETRSFEFRSTVEETQQITTHGNHSRSTVCKYWSQHLLCHTSKHIYNATYREKIQQTVPQCPCRCVSVVRERVVVPTLEGHPVTPNDNWYV